MFALEEAHSSRRRPLRVAVAVASAVALVGVSALALRHGPSPKPQVLVPQATTTITCGQTIMVSIIVGNDLTCGSGHGLDVGHASITINLNGHTLAGNTTNPGINGAGFSAVTITNGTVSGWSYGVLADGAADKVTGIRAAASQVFGLFLTGVGASATGNVAYKNLEGIVVLGRGGKATSNVVRENGTGIGVGIGPGIVVQANQVENNSSNGIDVAAGSGATLTGNVTNANAGDGIHTAADPTATVTSNTANYNGAYGIEASPGGKDGGGNTAKGNTQATQCKDVVCA